MIFFSFNCLFFIATPSLHLYLLLRSHREENQTAMKVNTEPREVNRQTEETDR